ncbi:MAG: hypothetical protein AB1634_19395, partial [Thermodesulfobacteriota bacterium]
MAVPEPAWLAVLTAAVYLSLALELLFFAAPSPVASHRVLAAPAGPAAWLTLGLAAAALLLLLLP